MPQTIEELAEMLAKRDGISYDEELAAKRAECAEKCFDFNNTRPSDYEGQKKILDTVFGEIKGDYFITQPFYCDYGFFFYFI